MRVSHSPVTYAVSQNNQPMEDGCNDWKELLVGVGG